MRQHCAFTLHLWTHLISPTSLTSQPPRAICPLPHLQPLCSSSPNSACTSSFMPLPLYHMDSPLPGTHTQFRMGLTATTSILMTRDAAALHAGGPSLILDIWVHLRCFRVHFLPSCSATGRTWHSSLRLLRHG